MINGKLSRAMEPISLQKKDLAVMYAHAEREYPNECCGVIIGVHGDPSKNETRPCKNIQNELKDKYPGENLRSADTGYFMDPADVRAAFENAAKKKLDVIGFYHSHPDHEPYWSKEDHKASMWAGTCDPSFPDASNIVISVVDGVVKGAAIFCWDEEAKKHIRSDIA